MKRLFFGHLFVLLSLSLSVGASELRRELKGNVDGLNQENCVELMGSLEYDIENLKASDYQKEIIEEGHETLLHDLWNSKINIHERLRSFHNSSGLVADCAGASRKALRAIRTAEDYINDSLLKVNSKTMKFQDNAFEKDNIHVRRHPDMAGFDLKKNLKSGDVILTRGNAFTSAAIANLGEYDTQFSHMSIVYRDNKDQLWTVEAHIEVGVFVRPLKDHIEDKNARTMVFRFDDEALAARAAQYIFYKVKKASDTTGNIFYDFGFNQDDSSQLFCSEVVSHAFAFASGGEVKIPYNRSRLLQRKPQFVKMLGINVPTSFIPADIEIDPRFKIIAEWRDANKIADNLQKDAIMQAVFRWNDELGYEMKQASSKKSFLYRNIAWPLRRVPFLKKYFKDKLPINMGRALIGYFGVIESIGEFLQKGLKGLDEKARKERGLLLTKTEKAETLENIRLYDLAQRRKKLHKMIRPGK